MNYEEEKRKEDTSSGEPRVKIKRLMNKKVLSKKLVKLEIVKANVKAIHRPKETVKEIERLSKMEMRYMPPMSSDQNNQKVALESGNSKYL